MTCHHEHRVVGRASVLSRVGSLISDPLMTKEDVRDSIIQGYSVVVVLVKHATPSRNTVGLHWYLFVSPSPIVLAVQNGE